MSGVTAIVSMLHEPAEPNSATRRFRGLPVLRWTVERLGRAHRLGAVAVLCWDDQLAAVNPIASEGRADVITRGARSRLATVEAVAAARRWADGWRGGLLSTCHFDLGFHGPWHHEVARQHQSDAVVLVDPSAALIDPALIDDLVAHAQQHAALELCFLPAAPGLDSVLLRTALLARLADANVHPGRLLHYHPDQVSREPLAAESCVPVPTPVARTTDRFTLDSNRQLRRIAAAVESLNGQLISTGTEELVRRARGAAGPDALPREIVLELNTARSTTPIFSPARSLAIRRPDLRLDLARRLFGELAALDDTRLTLAGVGDPLLHPDVFAIMEAAKCEGNLSVHIETDLHEVSAEQLARLAAAPVDVISVHLPALSPQTYSAVMGCDGYLKVVDNIRRFAAERHARGSLLPILAPVFTKCRDNLGEMETWYDQWIRAVGSAVIRGPGDCAGQIPDVGVADMAPPGRKPCARIASRVSILCDGSVVSCEEDVLGRQVMGHLGTDSLREIWHGRFESLQAAHRAARWGQHDLCKGCREWHRP